VDYSDFSGGTAYTFDVATMMVIGLRTTSDTPFGDCRVNAYVYGEFGEDCADDITCYPCDDLASGAAGAGGAEDVGKPAACPTF
jgi:hypothetical protein